MYVFLRQILAQIKKGHIRSLTDIFFYNRWKRSLLTPQDVVTDRMPWINFKAIDKLKRYLKPESKIFEYGGGGSTFFFLDRGSEVVTIEHDPEWFKILSQNIDLPLKEKWRGNLILPEMNLTESNFDIADPDHYFSSSEDFANMNFKRYSSYIDKYPDNYFDVILIDGRARPSCIKHAICKVKQGGLLILDNADRQFYLKCTINMLHSFKLISGNLSPTIYLHGFTQTNIWQKISL